MEPEQSLDLLQCFWRFIVEINDSSSIGTPAFFSLSPKGIYNVLTFLAIFFCFFFGCICLSPKMPPFFLFCLAHWCHVNSRHVLSHILCSNICLLCVVFFYFIFMSSLSAALSHVLVDIRWSFWGCFDRENLSLSYSTECSLCSLCVCLG